MTTTQTGQHMVNETENLLYNTPTSYIHKNHHCHSGFILDSMTRNKHNSQTDVSDF